jgi:hypothetical protein
VKQVCNPEIPLGQGWYAPWTELTKQPIVLDVVRSAHRGKGSEFGEVQWGQGAAGRSPNVLGGLLH